MMNKKLMALCVAAIAVSGCNATDNTENAQSGDAAALAVTSDALKTRDFGKIGGAPWSNEVTYTSNAPQSGHKFGRALAIADVSLDHHQDIITSSGAIAQHGKLHVIRPASSTPINDYNLNRNKPDTIDNLGDDLVAGNLCPDLTGRDIIVASAPDYNNYRGLIGFFYRLPGNTGTDRQILMRKYFNLATPYGRAGTRLAVGDLDKDGKNDLVFQSMPVDSEFIWQPSTVSVVYDFCSKSGTLGEDVVENVKTSSLAHSDDGYGSALYVADLDQSGSPELVVVDNSYRSSSNPELSPEGAIFFFKFVAGRLEESRKPLIGELDRSGGSINSVAFSDINGDGKLDLIVGEPYHQTSAFREGRVRTYINRGPGMAFDPSETPVWSATGGSKNMRFGSTVLVDDLNEDGVNDLIVGAPGWRDTTGSTQAMVYVYLGTKDGSAFSTIPVKSDPFEYLPDVKYESAAYWTAKSGVAYANNDDFSRNIAVMDLDGSGWKDIVVAAPGYGPDSGNLDQGRIHIFSADLSPCYTADKCLIDNKCFDDGAAVGDNACYVCDPSQHNFDFSLKTCDYDHTNACIKGAECRPGSGCVDIPVDDGQSCGSPSCNSTGTVLTTRTCQNGLCTKSDANCGNYICNISQDVCPTSCVKDTECQPNYYCDSSHKCTQTPPNTPPVAVLASEYSAKPGTEIQLNASKSYDPDGNEITFMWTGDTQYMRRITSSRPYFAVPADADPDSVYYVTVTVTDAYGATDSADTKIIVLPPDPVNQPPYVEVVSAFEVEAGESIKIDAIAYDPDGDPITVQWTGSGANFLSTRLSANTVFTAPDNAAAGATYDLIIRAEDDKGAASSAFVTITIKKSKPNSLPVIDLARDFTYVPGEELVIDATKSFDPDGDKLTFQWEINGKGALSDATSAAPIYTALDAEDNNTSVLKLTVSDGKASVEQETLVTTAVANNGSIIIDSPIEQMVVPTNTAVTGYTFPNSDLLILDTTTGQLICGTHSDIETGIFTCNVQLDEGEHSIVAYLINEYGGHVSKAEVTNFYASSVTLKTPANESTYSTISIIYSGTANPGTEVQVHLYPEDIVACVAIANEDGFWSCDDSSYRQPGTYLVSAIDSTLVGDYTAPKNQFLVVQSTIDYEPTDGYDARGGSCSVSPVSSGNFAPFALLACCGACLVYRRRKSAR